MLQDDANGPTLGESLANAHSVGKLKKETPNYSKNNLFICFHILQKCIGYLLFARGWGCMEGNTSPL